MVPFVSVSVPMELADEVPKALDRRRAFGHVVTKQSGRNVPATLAIRRNGRLDLS